ncbi:hypothetical protein FNV43_RR17043 [Rhamnella rubrinervis]|uniref:Uncharacterized protein n=1 Tax=Rhamnella rubrinervis TaxID=2594499 RepID=A0A8K0ME76_9ROSA|nr:hypothetical protein FNV43_RR17043 [Rhamnella rubrinervis]
MSPTNSLQILSIATFGENTEIESVEEQTKQVGSLRQLARKTREDNDLHERKEPHAALKEYSLLELFRELTNTVTRRFPCDKEITRHTVESRLIQEFVRFSTKRRDSGKAVEEEPSNHKEPRQRDKRRFGKRRRAGSKKPQEDLHDHLNRKAASRSLHQKASSSYRRPLKEEEDLRDVLRTPRAKKPETRRQTTSVSHTSEPDVGRMNEELR